jgi:hypothetical protein
MSYDRLVERCARDFERYVARLHFDVAHNCRVNIPWAPYEQRFTKTHIPMLIREVRKAYEARAAFALEGPTWAQMLPIFMEEIHPLQKATGAMHVLGCYASSLQLMNHDYLAHPRFPTFACGMMAHPDAPEHVRNDMDLQAEFPAKELPGLSSRMIWFGKRLPLPERLQALGDKRLLA